MNIITNDKEKSAQAIDGLKNVIDPEIGLNVVDLGLIYQIDFDEAEKKVYCTMTLTTQFCPMGESISTGVTNDHPFWHGRLARHHRGRVHLRKCAPLRAGGCGLS